MSLIKRNLSAASSPFSLVESSPPPLWMRQAENILLLILTYLTSVSIQRHYFVLLLALVAALILYGFRRPHNLLGLALILAPLDLGLTGDLDDHIPVIFSISDVLLLMALPGALPRLWRRSETWKMDGMGLPMLCYLLAGLLSFGANLRFMHGHGMGYFSGWLRNAQSVLILPLLYASLDWNWPQIRNTLRGYLACVLVIAGWGLINFGRGMRAGLYILGIHKNVLGLAMALAALIALISWLPPLRRERFADRINLLEAPPPLLMGAFALFLLTLACSLSRGSLLSLIGGLIFVCVLWRRPALFAALMLLIIAAVYGVRQTLPLTGKQYMTNFSDRSASVGDRLGMIRESAIRFRAEPVLGDGFRIRRDILPHNMEAMVLAENGLLGFLLLVWGMVAQIRLLRRGYRAFSHDPPLQNFVVIVGACTLALLIHGQVEPYWRRGPLLLVWAGTGIVWTLMLQKSRENRAEALAAQQKPVDSAETAALNSAMIS